MVQELVMALERRPQTAWMVWLSKGAGSFLNRLFIFLDNERAVVHAGTTSVLMFFGLKLAMPGSTFKSSISGYKWFMTHWPYVEDGWAALLITIALISYSALLFGQTKPTRLVNGRPEATLTESYQVLAAGLLLSAHVNIAWGFWNGNPYGTATFTYSIIGVFSAWVIYRIQRRGGIWT
jgi:hypothetical protein